MIHLRRTVQIAPGRQADAVARAHEWAKTYKDSTGIHIRVSVVTTGTLGKLCLSVDFESMGARQASDAKWQASPATQALGARQGQEVRAGTCAQLTETFYDEIWRDA